MQRKQGRKADRQPGDHSADAILGIFGTSDKALLVIPNKVYQGLAVGRAVLTAATPAFVPELRADEDHGMFWARPGDPASVCDARRAPSPPA